MRFSLRAWRRQRVETVPQRRRPVLRPCLEVLENRLVPSADFVQTNLVSDISGLAATTDANLINPWGLVAGPGGPWWVANQGTSTSTLYNSQGVPQPAPPNNPLVVKVPPSSPTGIVFNTAGSGFNVTENGKTGSSIFLFDTLAGTIDGWAPGVDRTNAVVAVPSSGAVFTGLAIATDSKAGTLLYAADHKNGVIDVYDQNFKLVTTLPGNFTDPNLPADASPFNIQNINGKLYVEYTEGSGGPGKGFVDVFNTDGTRDTQIGKGGRLISGGALDNPWGIALAPSNFGAFSNDYLVGNFGDGHINAFDQKGHFVGELMTSNGQPFEEDHLWSLQFGNGGANGSTNTLFFTAGIDNEKHGLFGSLQAVPTLPPNSPIVPNLGILPKQAISTIASNGDQNPYGVAFVPQDFQGGGLLAPGDILVSNFNNATTAQGGNLQGTGTTIVKITPDGQQTTFFQGGPGLGLTTALGVLPQGFVIVGSVPTTDGTSATIQNGELLIIDSFGHEVGTISDSALLQGPWDLTVHSVDATHAQVFISNVLSGTVTRIDFTIPNGGTPQVESETQIASGYVHRSDPAALVIGPTGLAFDAKTDTLYVASTGDNAIYAISHAATTTTDQGKGKLVVSDPQHLHGPLGLLIAPNGDFIVANGDAVNADPNQPSELVEFTHNGKFVGQFSLDPNFDAPFGIALQTVGDQTRFAAVNDNSNTVEIWTLLTQKSSGDNGGDSGATTIPGASLPGDNGSSMPAPTASSSTDALAQAVDAIFQAFNAEVKALEASLLSMDPQLAGLISMVNADLYAVEAMIESNL